MQIHDAAERAYQRAAWDEHRAGQNGEMEIGERWVEDSWFQPYRYSTYLQKSEQWKSRSTPTIRVSFAGILLTSRTPECSLLMLNTWIV